MIYRNLSGFKKPLPAVTFGGAAVSGEGGGYGFGAMSEGEAERLLKKAWKLGITLFDTAPIYGFGLSEERLGRYLPAEAMVISKSGVDWHPTKRVNMTNSPVNTERMLHESLKRLQRDHIDIYMIHWPDSKFDIREPLSVLKKAQEQGKIGHIGLCNTTLEDLKKAREIVTVEVLQSELNLFNSESFDRLQNEWHDSFSMGWGTFDKGILSGRVTKERTFDPSDARHWAPWWNKKAVQLKIDRTIKLQKILLDYDLSLQEFCLHYSLYYYGLSTALIGFKTDADLVQTTSTLQQKLTRERIEEVLVRFK
jgi:aryl-alcohol dehydrogenase-like predicted oxidoreductase